MKKFAIILMVFGLAACQKPVTNICKNGSSGYLKYAPQSGSCMDWYIVTNNGWLMPANLEAYVPQPVDGQTVNFSFEYAPTPAMNYYCPLAPLITITCLKMPKPAPTSGLLPTNPGNQAYTTPWSFSALQQVAGL
ncbi:MAG: hypothetical protein U0T84_03705 [Chitinophagales bacterium]